MFTSESIDVVTPSEESSTSDSSDTNTPSEESSTPNEEQPHVHTWDDGQIVNYATCTTTGLKVLTCTTCEDTKLEVIKALNKVADVTIAISNDEANSELFLLNKKTIEKLKKFKKLIN